MTIIFKTASFFAESLKLQVAYRVEQDVGGLEVAVDHRRVGIVEKGKALGRDDSDLHPCHPQEGTICTLRK